MSRHRIRILIADDEPAVRDALIDLLKGEREMEIVATAGDAPSAIRLALHHHPDVALLDVRMPGGGGTRAAREIHAGSPRTRILALSAYDDRGTVLDMVRSGAAGYLVKGAGAIEIVDAIHRSLRGYGTLSAEVTADVLDELAGHLQEQARESEEEHQRRDRIDRVLNDGYLAVVFQPVVDLTSGRVVGLEALSRFRTQPYRSPERWFAEAAAIGLGVELEVRAASLALEAIDRIPEGTYLAVNVSPETSASPEFRDLISGVPDGRLVIEVTEHAEVEDYRPLSSALDGLRGMGIRLAVDDAGAGFASPRHVLNLAPEIIKLDMSLTRDVHSDRGRRALAAALISFAAELGSTIVAEGIESRDELAALQTLRVPCGQGHFLAPPGPLPVNRVLRLLD